MLTFLDFLLIAIFTVLPPALFVIGGVVRLFDPEEGLRTKLDSVGWFLVLLCATIWLFGWIDPWTAEDAAFAAYSNPDFPDYSFLPATVASFFAMLTVVAALVLEGVGLPMCLVGLLYLGILIFGL